MTDMVWFDEARSEDRSIVGGKAANLGRMARAGFRVPAGFTVPTTAYADFLAATGLTGSIAAQLDGSDGEDPRSLDAAAAKIRELIEATELPDALRDAVTSAYTRLGSDYVAVRSSGAAEDLEDASFAGLHDSYLDVRGGVDVCAAVRRCWASLWTTRAISYRTTNGYDHFASPIAVVVQTMVESDVSGVIFTANPVNTATDEVVINASWGLGEAIVSGIVNPDEFVVQFGLAPPLRHEFARKDLGVIVRRGTGSKTTQVVRDPATGTGTVVQDVPEGRRSVTCLDDDQVLELARVARDVQAHYGGLPQDLEFAISDGVVHVVQTRPITGVEFSWDAEVNDSVPGGEEPDWIWSRRWADEAWTGPITPLMYSWRCYTWHHGHKRAMQTIGMEELDYTQMRMWKFYKGRVYFNAQLERALYEKTMPAQLRQAVVPSLPPDWREDVLATPLSLLRWLKMYAKSQVAHPETTYNWPTTMAEFVAGNEETFNGLSVDEVRELPDAELDRYIDHMIYIEHRWYPYTWMGLLFIMRDAQLLLGGLLAKWYDGPNASAFTDLIMGTDERTFTAVENERLWQLAHRIRTSPAIRETFETHKDGDFFLALRDSDEGRLFLEDYDDFVTRFGHRGAAERDMSYPRRAEDPALDYRALAMLIVGEEQTDPEDLERQVNARREAAYEEVVANLRRGPFGAAKAQAFAWLYRYIHRMLIARDNERGFTDRPTLAIKRAFADVNRRMREAGIFDNDWDYNFLTRDELFAARSRGALTDLDRAKIAARQRDFDRQDAKAVAPPVFIQHGQPAALEVAEASGDGVFRGNATSSGVITGTARIVRTLDGIGRVQPDDILITYSTDPGWTPVFMVVKGLVLETGGLLAHGATLAREYGIPAVQLDHAMTLVEDGATVTVDGNSGTVTVLPSTDAAVPLAAPTA